MKEKGMELEKEEKKKMRMSCDDDDDDFCPPYKVSFPGEYDPYELRPLTDPRLGCGQKQKEKFYKIHGFSDDEDNDDDMGSSEDERKDKSEDESPPDEDGPDEDGSDEDGPDESESESEDESSSDAPLRIINVPIGHLSSTPDLPPIMSEAEQFNSFKRTWKKHFKRAIQNEAKNLMKRDCQCAEAAIKFYNQKHGTDYEIVETLGSYRRIYLGFWYHCNFRAQCKSDPSSPPKLFFAELQTTQLPNLIVENCVPLNRPQNNGSTVVRGCYMCGNQLLHPVDGFEAGKTDRPVYSCRVSRRHRVF